MKLIIKLIIYSSLLLYSINVFPQGDPKNIQKYWWYHHRLTHYFMVIGEGPGEGIPADIRNRDNNESLDWGEGPVTLGYYIGVLATEYHLLRQNNQNTDQTLTELYYALKAVERLDYTAEQIWSATNSRNGFLLRDDVPETFILDHTPTSFNLNTNLTSTWPVVTPNSGTPGFVSVVMSSGTNFTKLVERAASKDMLFNLLMGLALCKHFVTDNPWVEDNSYITFNNTITLSPLAYNFNYFARDEADKIVYAYKYKRLDIPILDYKAEAFYLRNFDKSKVMGWAHNATNFWYNIVGTCMPTLPGLGDPWIISSSEDDSYSNPIMYTGKIRLEHLSMASRYNIDWYYTRNLGASGAFSTVSGELTDLYGEMAPDFPLSFVQPDYAFKAVEDPFIDWDLIKFHDLGTVNLFCGEDTIQIDGTYKNDINGVYTYNWNFGNGQTSALVHPTVIYLQPGTYTTTLIVTDTVGEKDTLVQKFVVPNCENREAQISENNSNASILLENIKIYPNPNNGNFTILFPENNTTLYSIELYDITGRLVIKKENVLSEIELKIEQEMKGIYFVKIISENSVEIRKIVIQ